MKKTFRLLGIGLLAASVCLFSCNKAEDDEEEGGETSELTVSKTPQNRMVLLEEFTGDKCGYCPLGHKAANELVAANPGKVCVINYHCCAPNLAGHYVTNYGVTLNSNFNVEDGMTSIPAATINRHDFGLSSASTMITVGRSQYNLASQIMSMPACANVAARATIDKSTRKLTVEVKVYYTADGTGTTNKLHVALLQDNVMGSQSSMSGNPDQVVGSQYRHMEMFRDFVTTGQWGMDISPITNGSLISKTINYDIPESYTDPKNNNSEPAVLDNMRVVVFVTEGNREVINACNAEMVIK